MRYANAGIFALKRSSGELLDAASLQSNLYGDDGGLLENVSIDRNQGAGNRPSMTVRFQQGGKWINVEQEVRLNDPGAQNGHLRVWVDGKLRLDRRQMQFRESDETRFEGITVDVHYADSAMHWQAAPNATEVRISPLIVRWE